MWLQRGSNTRLVKTLNKKAKVGKYTIKYGSNGIGGGALIMKYSDFTKVGGYTNPDIYIGDDGHLIRSVFSAVKKEMWNMWTSHTLSSVSRKRHRT